MSEPKEFEIATEAEFRAKYPGYFEEQAKRMPPIDAQVVPESLRHLVPIAEQWGITAASWLRREFCEAATPETVAAFRQALAGTHPFFEDWSYTEPAEDEPDQAKAERIKYAQYRFGAMYLAELENFDDARGIRGFVDWYKEYDPEGYAQWLQS